MQTLFVMTTLVIAISILSHIHTHYCLTILGNLGFSILLKDCGGQELSQRAQAQAQPPWFWWRHL